MICLGGQPVVLHEAVVGVVWDLVSDSRLSLCGGEVLDVSDHYLGESLVEEGHEEDLVGHVVVDIVKDDVKAHNIVPVLFVNF